MKRLATEWENYQSVCVPKDAGDNQREGTRIAFYSGAAALFALMMNMLDSDKEPTDADLRRIDEVHRELEEFREELRRRAGVTSIGAA